ncbi:unnamed protein product [Pieris brassicae]|uniref:Uncharacterized protein n=1 Tax=Pieris brassicae TaxID=7116 RepID=A0A9P0T9M2_PIEBR|nr:unnamed protein product [Pieris brassicae]
MLVNIPMQMDYESALKMKDNFMECVVPRRPRRCLSPLPEDRECSNSDLRKSSLVNRRRRQRRRLPVVPEYDEC